MSNSGSGGGGKGKEDEINKQVHHVVQVIPVEERPVNHI
jgi:hypothetical protein